MKKRGLKNKTKKENRKRKKEERKKGNGKRKKEKEKGKDLQCFLVSQSWLSSSYNLDLSCDPWATTPRKNSKDLCHLTKTLSQDRQNRMSSGLDFQ